MHYELSWIKITITCDAHQKECYANLSFIIIPCTGQKSIFMDHILIFRGLWGSEKYLKEKDSYNSNISLTFYMNPS